MNTLQIIHRKAVLTLIPATGPTLVLQAEAGPSIIFAAAGVQGPPGPPGPTGGLRFVQASAAALWTVNHNMGFRPQVTVLSAGGIEVDASVRHTSINQFQISFNTPQAGSAEYQ